MFGGLGRESADNRFFGRLTVGSDGTFGSNVLGQFLRDFGAWVPALTGQEFPVLDFPVLVQDVQRILKRDRGAIGLLELR